MASVAEILKAEISARLSSPALNPKMYGAIITAVQELEDLGKSIEEIELTRLQFAKLKGILKDRLPPDSSGGFHS